VAQKRLIKFWAITISLIVLLPCFFIAARALSSYKDPNDISLSNIGGPLPEEAFRGTIDMPFSDSLSMKPGERRSIHYVVTNRSHFMWPAKGSTEGEFQITLGNHWLDESGKIIILDDGRSRLPYDLLPGKSVEILLNVAAPTQPGNYTLEVDLVQEGVAWFVQKGSKALRSVVRVENPK
jgi:hypothetical protein